MTRESNNLLENMERHVWHPRIFLQSKMTAAERQADDFERKICSILNKLTPQNFRKLFNRLINLNVNDEEKLKKIVTCVFRKCLDEHLYSQLYARLCCALIDTVKVSSANHAGIISTFLHIEVDKIISIIMNIAEPGLNTYAERHEVFCSVIFIGQLYNKKLLSDGYFHTNFVKTLFVKQSPNQKRYEYQLECLCKVLQTTGSILENQNLHFLDDYFKTLQEIYNAEKTSTRLKMLLLNLFESRKNHWMDMLKKERPVTIDQIRSLRGG